MNLNKIISEEITKYLSDKCMLKEYKNPNDAETVRVCGDTLEQLYQRILGEGCSKREITMEMLAKIISDIRHLEQVMR
jgi:hypothetical protein